MGKSLDVVMQRTRSLAITAFECGYMACEKGYNIQKALEIFKTEYDGKGKVRFTEAVQPIRMYRDGMPD